MQFMLQFFLQMIGVYAAEIFNLRCRVVRRAVYGLRVRVAGHYSPVMRIVLPSLTHQVALTQLVQQHELPFAFLNIVIYPDFVFWHERIDRIVSSLGKIYETQRANHFAINDPDGKKITCVRRETFFMHLF